MSKRIVATLSASSMQAAMQQLQDYKKNLQHKCEIFVQRLANKGIIVAEQNLGAYGNFITFNVEVNPHQNGATAILIATNTGIIKSQWITKEGVKEADVSPLLMAEFGSGLRANNARAGEFGMGTGTFPGQTHAEDPDGWWYMDLSGEWHHSYGVSPTMPMWRAAMEIHDQIIETAREVFGS